MGRNVSAHGSPLESIDKKYLTSVLAQLLADGKPAFEVHGLPMPFLSFDHPVVISKSHS